ncbi:hypothetical protein Pmani_012224 [Petrolisthes manimaculis]|uniref:Uncharacterized protein n=1 Tax=Petrolisthes manimaculis TaxID=1843537 RepID=A0AAE1PZM2_9EUCA|nr:hypothetical protein Pmani_012224 [Petrolisthes manimaculis]
MTPFEGSQIHPSPPPQSNPSLTTTSVKSIPHHHLSQIHPSPPPQSNPPLTTTSVKSMPIITSVKSTSLHLCQIHLSSNTS